MSLCVSNILLSCIMGPTVLLFCKDFSFLEKYRVGLSLLSSSILCDLNLSSKSDLSCSSLSFILSMTFLVVRELI